MFIFKYKKNKNVVYIYSLADPRTGSVRYIGKSIDPRSRYNTHLTHARCSRENTHVSKWIKTVLAEGLKPIVNIIDVCNASNWEEREIYYIKHYKTLGCDLTNLEPGGVSTKHVNKVARERKKKILDNSLFSDKNWEIILKGRIEAKNKLEKEIKARKDNRSCPIKTRIVLMKDKEGNLIERFDSLNAIITKYPNFRKSKIIQICNKVYITYKGYKWEYENIVVPERIKRSSNKPVLRLDLNNNVVDEFNSLVDAEIKLGIKRKIVGRCCNREQRSYKGFQFMFKADYLCLQAN